VVRTVAFRSDRESKHEHIAEFRADPSKWIPLLIDVYKELSNIMSSLGIDIVVAGAGAYSIHVELDSTKDIDLVLLKPVNIEILGRVLLELSNKLMSKRWRVVGERIQLGRSSEDWVAQIFIAVKPGHIIGVEIFNFLAVRPLTLYEVKETVLQGTTLKVLSLESWIASKFADPNGIDVHNLKRLEKAVMMEIDEVKLLEILRRLGMDEVIKLNARSILRKTHSEKLIRIAQLLA